MMIETQSFFTNTWTMCFIEVENKIVRVWKKMTCQALESSSSLFAETIDTLCLRKGKTKEFYINLRIYIDIWFHEKEATKVDARKLFMVRQHQQNIGMLN
eukprot:snap_masked-scaffold_14-processed-gene-9.15-mRNA-1 protein AED:1.00 eAED:1.00 QI:0/0/0/0/1/1/2/0/99